MNISGEDKKFVTCIYVYLEENLIRHLWNITSFAMPVNNIMPSTFIN